MKKGNGKIISKGERGKRVIVDGGVGIGVEFGIV